MLSHTVENGSGKLANVAGWNVAGKTGTSKKLIEDNIQKKIYIKFCGIFSCRKSSIIVFNHS